MFTHLGVEVVDERPYEITAPTARPCYDLRLRAARARRRDLDRRAPASGVRELFQDAFARRLERPGRERRVQRARPRRRAHLAPGRHPARRTPSTCARPGRPSARTTSSRALRRQRRASPRLLVELFEARFDPDRYRRRGPAGRARGRRGRAASSRSRRPSTTVASLDHDRIIRAFLGVIQATLRTNFFQRDADGAAQAVRLAQARPARRCPTCRRRGRCSRSGSTRPRVEGVHLRFGKVARGGLRWSDRREDFRTEVLGLVKAQMVKNAVIVPTGSKGGFFAKQLPDPAVDREAWLAEGIACYKMFISGLLDLTDNLVGGRGRAARRAWCGTTATTPTSSSPPTRARRRSPTSPTASRSRLRLLARRRVRLGRLGRLRPQGDGHHRARRLGVGQAALPRDGRRHPDRRTSPSSASAT